MKDTDICFYLWNGEADPPSNFLCQFCGRHEEAKVLRGFYDAGGGFHFVCWDCLEARSETIKERIKQRIGLAEKELRDRGEVANPFVREVQLPFLRLLLDQEFLNPDREEIATMHAEEQAIITYIENGVRTP